MKYHENWLALRSLNYKWFHTQVESRSRRLVTVCFHPWSANFFADKNLTDVIRDALICLPLLTIANALGHPLTCQYLTYGIQLMSLSWLKRKWMKESKGQHWQMSLWPGCQSCASTSAATDMKNNGSVCLDPMVRPLHKCITIQALKMHNDSRCNGEHFHRSEEFSP